MKKMNESSTLGQLFSLIAPILNGIFEDDSIKAYLKRICAQKYDIPGVGIKEYASVDTLSLATVSRFIAKNSFKFRDIHPK